MNFDYLFTEYGIKPMSFEEELVMPKFAKQTRNNKIYTISKIEFIKNTLDSIKNSMRGAPELDDEEHAARVQKLADDITEIETVVNKAFKSIYR